MWVRYPTDVESLGECALDRAYLVSHLFVLEDLLMNRGRRRIGKERGDVFGFSVLRMLYGF